MGGLSGVTDTENTALFFDLSRFAKQIGIGQTQRFPKSMIWLKPTAKSENDQNLGLYENLNTTLTVFAPTASPTLGDLSQ